MMRSSPPLRSWPATAAGRWTPTATTFAASSSGRADNELAVLAATRPHIELYRGWMEERDLAASTIDRRLSTVCGFYRFAHIDGRIASNPAQYVRRPQVHPSNRGLDRSELGVFLFTAETLRPRPRRSRRAARPQRSPGERGVRHQHRGPRVRARPSHPAHPRQGQQARHDPPGPAHGTHHRPRHRRTPRRTDPAETRRPAPRPAHRAPLGAVDRQASRPRRSAPSHAAGRVHHGRARRRCPARDVQIAARHADPRTTTIYDRRRQNFDRHAAYVVVAFVAGG